MWWRIGRISQKTVCTASLLLFIFYCASVNASQNDDVEKGINLFQERKYAEAQLFFANFIKDHPQDARAAYYLGRISFANNDLDAAIKWFETATKAEKEAADYHHWLGRAYGRKAMRANVFKKASLAGKIRSEFEKAVALAPDNVEARFDMLQYYVMAPGFMGGSRDKALTQAREIKTRNLLQGHAAYATIYENDKQYEKAQNEFLNATTALPDSIGAYRMLGEFHERRGHHDKAVEVAQQVIARFPEKRKDAHLQLGQLYMQMKLYDKALASFDTSIAIDYEFWNGFYQIGRLGALSGQHLERAAEAMKIYIKNEPVGDDLPSLAWAHVRLGMVYEHQGKKELAVSEFQQALKLEPKHEEAKKGLRRVE